MTKYRFKEISELLYNNQKFFIQIHELSTYSAFLAYLIRKNALFIPNFDWGDRIFLEFDVVFDIRFSQRDFKHPFLTRNIEAYYQCKYNFPQKITLSFNLRETKFNKLDNLSKNFTNKFVYNYPWPMDNKYRYCLTNSKILFLCYKPFITKNGIVTYY